MIETTLHQWLEHWINVRPSQEFLIYPDRSLRLTFMDFNERVNRFSKGLIRLGVSKGARVGVWAGNIPDWITLMFACSKIGAVMVVVDTNYSKSEVEYVMSDSEVHTMCVANGGVSVLNDIVPELRSQQRGHLFSSSVPKLRNVVYLGAEKHRGMYNSTELNVLGAQTSNEELSMRSRSASCHDEVAVYYRGRGVELFERVVLSHYNIVNSGKLLGDSVGYTNLDRLLLSLPSSCNLGCMLGVCSAVTHCSLVVVAEDLEVSRALAMVESEGCSSVLGLAGMFLGVGEGLSELGSLVVLGDGFSGDELRLLRGLVGGGRVLVVGDLGRSLMGRESCEL